MGRCYIVFDARLRYLVVYILWHVFFYDFTKSFRKQANKLTMVLIFDGNSEHVAWKKTGYSKHEAEAKKYEHLYGQLCTGSMVLFIVCVFAATAALRTTRGSPYVRPSVSFSFFAIYSSKLQATHTSKFVILCIIFLRMPLWKKRFQQFCVRGGTALFGHQAQK